MRQILSLGSYMRAILIIVCALHAQDITEEGSVVEPDVTPSLQLSAPPQQPRPMPYVLPLIKAKNSQTIFGASTYFAGMALDWGVLLPWSFRFSAHLVATDTVTAEDASESLRMLAAGIPIGMMQIGGASIACAGASRVYGIYHETVSPEIKDVRVWIPYIIGWVGRGAGTALGLLGGLTNSTGLSFTASALSIAGQAAWTTSTVMSLVYSNRWRGEARMKLSLIPLYSPDMGSGMMVNAEF